MANEVEGSPVRVAAAMSPATYRVYPHTPLAEVAELMVRRELRWVPVVGEEFGFLGVLGTLALFAGLIWALVKIAGRVADPFASMLVFGIASMLLTHVVVNIGMTVGVMPITGIPLPFFSYGGSFMLTCCVAIGLAWRVSRESYGAAYSSS